MNWIRLGMVILLAQTLDGAAEAIRPQVGPLIADIESRHKDVEVLATAFRQDKYFSFMLEPVSSKGFMIYERSGRLRFELTEPFVSAILNDGKVIKRFEKVQGQWKVIDFAGNKYLKLVMDQIGLWAQGKFSEQDKVFKLSLTFDDPNSYAELNLTPRIKQIETYIEKIKIAITAPPELQVKAIYIYEPGGDYTRMTFTRELRNVQLPEGCFERAEQSQACQKLFVVEENKDPGGVQKGQPDGHENDEARP